jgi:hypothetical protein
MRNGRFQHSLAARPTLAEKLGDNFAACMAIDFDERFFRRPAEPNFRRNVFHQRLHLRGERFRPDAT